MKKIMLGFFLLCSIFIYAQTAAGNPENAKVYYNRGLEKVALGKYKEGSADFTEAIRLNPNKADFYVSQGAASYLLEEYKIAIKHYTKAIQLNPKDGMAYYGRGRAQMALKKKRKASSDYEKALELSPEYSFSYAVGIPKKASKEYKEYMELDERYAKTIENFPDTPGFYEGRGALQKMLEDYSKAMEYYTKAIQIDSKYAKAYYGRSFVKAYLGDKKGAAEDLKKAEEFGFFTYLKRLEELERRNNEAKSND